MFFSLLWNKNIFMQTLQVAKDANAYARSQIIKTSTRLENNNLAQDQQDYLKRALGSCHYEDAYGIRDLIYEQYKKNKQQGQDKQLAWHNSVVAVTSKYSIGNCSELAHQAFDYILKKAPTMRAEIYRIVGGDHAFVVINRNPTSDPHNPLTWGANAVVCDPWANSVFPARYCPTMLKIYWYDDKTKTNNICDYDPKIHKLEPRPFDTESLRVPKKR
jgi:hypothetical protein